VSFPFAKGHGTGNDFVVLPDLDGSIHGDLDPAVVVAVCDRRRGIGADGVLRVLRGQPGAAPWFMDYRNADGSLSQMCGNGVRVFARYLVAAGLVDADVLAGPLVVGTRDGDKLVSFCPDGDLSVDMGAPVVSGTVEISCEGRRYEAVRVDLGNPHAVAFVDDLEKVGALRQSPYFCGVEFPDGVNVEFVERRGRTELALRVYERGVGETMSCGTGACAAVAAAYAGPVSDAAPKRATSARPATYGVQVPGGLLSVTWDERGHVHLKGPAVLVADGHWSG
jgi:diaminopimelate epimerase